MFYIYIRLDFNVSVSDSVLHFSEDSHRFWEGFRLFIFIKSFFPYSARRSTPSPCKRERQGNIFDSLQNNKASNDKLHPTPSLYRKIRKGGVMCSHCTGQLKENVFDF